MIYLRARSLVQVQDGTTMPGKRIEATKSSASFPLTALTFRQKKNQNFDSKIGNMERGKVGSRNGKKTVGFK
jgi:hypothetical protein